MTIQKTLLLAHILAFSIFMGVIVSNIVARCWAERYLDSGALRVVLRLVVFLETRYIPPVVALVTVTGILLTVLNPSLLKQNWFLSILALWVVGAIIANVFFVPQVRRLANYLETSDQDHMTDSQYLAYSSRCTRTGIFLFVIPIAITLLNVYKPGVH